MSDQEQYSLTVISHGSDLSEETILYLEKFIGEKLKFIVSEKKILSKRRVLDYVVNIGQQLDETIGLLIKEEQLAKPPGYDIIFQKTSERKSKKLFIFDMDSTLIYQEVIELIAAYANIEDKVAEITERAMNGELDFTQSLQERVLLLKGIDSTSIWTELQTKIKITKGARELCRALSKLGCITGVCSGGFIPLAEHIKQELGLHYAYANVLGTDSQNILDGTTRGYVVNGDKKAELLLEIANNHQIDPTNAVAVGDGANDLKMMSVAGFGIAWNAKPKVQQAAPCCLNSDSLQDVLYIMGYNDDEIKDLIN